MSLIKTISEMSFFSGFGAGNRFLDRLTDSGDITEDKNRHQQLSQYAEKIKIKYIQRLIRAKHYNYISSTLFRIGFSMGSD